MQRNLKKIYLKFRYRWYLFLSICLAITIVMFNSPLVMSQTAVSQSVPKLPEQLINTQEFADIIDRLESKWEVDYEGYFQRDFDHQSRSVTRIAERLKEVGEQTSVNPAVIWAVPQNDFLQLILVTPEKQFVVRKIWGANRDRLTTRIEELEAAVTNPQSTAVEYIPPARIIYQWLLEPLEPYLEAENIDTLLLCTGEKLRSFPFAALHDGKKFIIEKYNLARIPAFSLTDTSYEPRSDRQVLAMGASEFARLPSLPGVETELNTIVPKLWSGRKIIEQDFTVENFQNAHQLGNFETVHIASHADFSAGSPENSFIQFSDRRLSLEQIADLDLELPQVNLLVLSACNTAIGNKDAEFGFAGLAIQAGVKSAIASLWSIEDAATVALMADFYQQYKSTPIKSAALKQAQIELLKNRVFIAGGKLQGLSVEVDLPLALAREDRDFSHPYFWSGFTTIGNPW